MSRVLVTGAGGFIGHHLCKYLVEKGHEVRGADLKRPEFEATSAQEFMLLDLRRFDDCLLATRGIEHVYHLAADMGGIGYITAVHAAVSRNIALINLQMLEAARMNEISRFFFSSTACVYSLDCQESPDVTPLKEEDAHPANPEEGYGWAKLFTEKLCQYYRDDYGLQTRVARFHNTYGPMGAFDGGREKAPAAICRKIAMAPREGEIEVWGDGKQTRTFMYIDDCVEGIVRIMQSDHSDPINLGNEELVTINQLVEYIADASGKKIRPRHDLSQPQGVRGRNSDNSRLESVLGWKPSIPLREGLAPTYRWIEDEMRKAGRIT